MISNELATTTDADQEVIDQGQLYSLGYQTADVSPYGSTAPVHDVAGTGTATPQKVAEPTHPSMGNEASARPLERPVKADGLQKWEGRVLQIEDDVFTAELERLDEDGPTIMAEFDIGLIDVDTEEGLSPGDVFYLTVRTVWNRGIPTRTSALRIRRLGYWSKGELSEVKSRAKRRLDSFISYVE